MMPVLTISEDQLEAIEAKCKVTGIVVNLPRSIARVVFDQG